MRFNVFDLIKKFCSNRITGVKLSGTEKPLAADAYVIAAGVDTGRMARLGILLKFIIWQL